MSDRFPPSPSGRSAPTRGLPPQSGTVRWRGVNRVLARVVGKIFGVGLEKCPGDQLFRGVRDRSRHLPQSRWVHPAKIRTANPASGSHCRRAIRERPARGVRGHLLRSAKERRETAGGAETNQIRREACPGAAPAFPRRKLPRSVHRAAFGPLRRRGKTEALRTQKGDSKRDLPRGESARPIWWVSFSRRGFVLDFLVPQPMERPGPGAGDVAVNHWSRSYPLRGSRSGDMDQEQADGDERDADVNEDGGIAQKAEVPRN